MIRVASLGSGSSGNSLLVQTDSTTLLVDCGFTMKETIARMYMLGVSPGEIDAVLLSHEHGDHVKGIGPLSRKFGLPVWCTHGTYHKARDNRFTSVRLFHAKCSLMAPIRRVCKRAFDLTTGILVMIRRVGYYAILIIRLYSSYSQGIYQSRTTRMRLP